MYNIKLEEYVPTPKPATSDRIVAAHYYAAWKKGAAGLHNGFDDLHEYPERTPLMGYYDEENPAVSDWEIKWALEHGINCFIYCWYRKLENMGKPVTVNDLRCPHGIHEALFNAKYGKMMKFAIMYENSDKWGTTDSGDIIKHLMPFWMENYFKKENYLIIDNKPVLFVFCQRRLSKVWPNPNDQKLAFDACREYAKKEGFDGMTFAVCDTSTSKNTADEMSDRGYDFRFGYSSGYNPRRNIPKEMTAEEYEEHFGFTSGYNPKKNMPDEDYIIEQQCEILKKRLELAPMKQPATASCFLDPTPRTTAHWINMGYDFHDYLVWYLSPDKFRILLRRMKEMTDVLPDGAWGKKIFMIDNWNEWDEGHYVAPSHEFGFRYLQAIREEFTKRDNLPDYRTPQDMGLANYNTSWEEPDFSK